MTATHCQSGYLASLYSFDSDLQCWKDHVGDGSVDGTTSYLSTTSPYAGAGCYGATVPFTGSSQHEQFEIDFASQAENLTGKGFRCWVKVSPQVMGTGSCTVKFLTQSGPVSSPWHWEASGDFSISAANTWIQFSWVPPWSAAGVSSSSVQRVGLQIYSGGSGAPSAGDVFIDEFEIFDVVPATPTSTPIAGAAQGWTFDSSLQSWAVDPSSTSPLNSTSIIAWDGTVEAGGGTSPGSVSLYAPYSGNGQDVLASYNSSTTSLFDLSGKSITVKVRVDSWSGLDLASYPGQATIVLKAYVGGSYIYARGPWVPLSALGNWVTLTIPNARTPSYAAPNYDATKIIQAAVDIQSAGSGTIGPAVFHIDNWLYQ
jgi:hypothetical protein